MILEHKHEEEGVFDMLEIKLSSVEQGVVGSEKKGLWRTESGPVPQMGQFFAFGSLDVLWYTIWVCFV